MTRQQKVAKIQRILDELYPQPPIPLTHQDPFTLLVAVLLSAQTTDKKVNEVTPTLFAVAPTAERMAQLSVEAILAQIRQLGLAPQKAKHLKQLSEILAARGGTVPQSFAELEALPGVGHKTASVVMAQAFGHPAFPVDTHIHRLAARWGLSSGQNVRQTEQDLKAAFPQSSWNKVHLQIIFFGREHCPARSHDLERCPICSWAAGQEQKATEQRPVSQEKRKPRQRKRNSGPAG